MWIFPGVFVQCTYMMSAGQYKITSSQEIFKSSSVDFIDIFTIQYELILEMSLCHKLKFSHP